MKYFIIICTFIFLVVMLYIDVVKYFVGEKYYEGLPIVPILLLANMCLGIYYNLSIWYKLTDRTGFGAYISIFGAIITTVLNVWWIPLIGYMGSAWATLICYASMMFISYFYGQKNYYIQYDMKRLLTYIGLSLGLFFISKYARFDMMLIQYVFNTILLFVFVGVVYSLEKSNFIRKPVTQITNKR